MAVKKYAKEAVTLTGICGNRDNNIIMGAKPNLIVKSELIKACLVGERLHPNS